MEKFAINISKKFKKPLRMYAAERDLGMNQAIDEILSKMFPWSEKEENA